MIDSLSSLHFICRWLPVGIKYIVNDCDRKLDYVRDLSKVVDLQKILVILLLPSSKIVLVLLKILILLKAMAISRLRLLLLPQGC